MRSLLAALALGALAGCGWFGGDEDPDRDVGAEDEYYRTTDPVTGQQVESDTPYRHEHMGRTYYFSSEENLRKFSENPSAYVDNDGQIPATRRADWERERAREVR